VEGNALGLIYGTILERLRKLRILYSGQSVSRPWFEPEIYRKQINSITAKANCIIIIIIIIIMISQWRKRYVDMELSNISLKF
jgi:hypothetical protein